MKDDLPHLEPRALRAAIDSFPDAVFIVGTDAIIRWANLSTSELTGLDSAELDGAHIDILSSKANPTEYGEMLRTFFASNNAGVTFEGIPFDRSETVRFIDITLRPASVFDPNTALYVVRDATERLAITARIERLESYPGINPNPVVEVSADGVVTYLNDAATRLLADIESRGPSHEFLAGLDSVVAILDAVGDESMSREVRVDDTWYYQAVRKVGTDGTIRIYAFDISVRKRAEFSLELLASAVKKSTDWVFITTVAGRIEYVNEVVSNSTGYDSEELIGANPRIWKSGYHDRQFYDRLWNTILSGEVFITVIVNKRRDGTRFSLDQTITPIKNSGGEITHFAATAKDITEQTELRERINFLSYYDVLTRLPNRVLFLDRLRQSLLSAERRSRIVAVVVADLDRFKYLNDVHGTAIGDSILTNVAKGLQAVVYERDTVCRFGNDEFGVSAELSKIEDVASLVDKIRTQIQRSAMSTAGTVSLTASIGISVYPDDGASAEELITNVDLALSQAKSEGRDAYHFFTPRLNARISEFVNMETNLRDALQNKEFVLYYQPYFDCASGAIAGIEALIRWNRTDGEVVGPASFIPVLEDSRLIVPVGEWTIFEACRQIAAWRREGYPVVPVSVNLSPVQFSETRLLERIRSIVRESGIDSSLVVFEITESTFMRNADYTHDVLDELQNSGFRVSIDDFGTGYSSLSYLKRFPIDNLKIDQSFVKGIISDADDEVLVATIISMAHNLKLKVIAEGVESAAHWNRLREFGCDMTQGFCCGKPMPADEIIGFLV